MATGVGADGAGIFNVGTLTLNSSSVSGNMATGVGADGGGIVNLDALMTMTNSTVSSNTANFGGGILNIDTPMTMTNSIVSGNDAVADGGGIFNSGFGGTLALDSSTVSGNMAGAFGGGIENNNGILTVTDSAVSGNTATFDGGGIDNFGFLGQVTLTNSTVSGNTAGDDGGGIHNDSGATATLTNSTVSGNTAADDGGGIHNDSGATAGGPLTLKNTIVANQASGADCSGTITSAGHNLDGDGTCGLTGTGDLPNGNANLGSLALNAPGTTNTHALLAGSDAIDAVPVADCTDVGGSPITSDQRGVVRPQGPACDIGAFEFGDADVDGDGIPDAVELFGVRDAAGTLVADMAALGADPCRKTVAVEIDFMAGALDGHTHQPKAAAIAEAVAAFNDAPVAAVASCPYAGFPTQASGVNLVIDIDDAIPEAPALSFGSGFETTKVANFEAPRAPYFHYNLWVHDKSVGNSSSGVGELPGNDFIVSLGSWTNQVGTVRQQSGTFIHELGHNLDLRHGGGDNVNRKPNYLSVMSYSFQTTGILDGATSTAAIDYSRSALANLTESALDENAGIGDGTLITSWRDLNYDAQVGQGDGPLDWTGNNFDGSGTSNDDVPVSVDINRDGFCVGRGSNGVLDTTPSGDDVIVSFFGTRIMNGPNHTCDSTAVGDDSQIRPVGFSEPTPLTGFNDWANLDYIFTDEASFADGVHIVPDEPEITFEEALIIEESYRLPVDIDIKPGSDPNSINPKGKGKIPVAILTTPTFDATTVDADTVQFGPGAASKLHKKAHVEDVDGDGDLDLVLHFRTQDTGIAPGDTEACLTGETFGGQPIVGCDSVNVVP